MVQQRAWLELFTGVVHPNIFQSSKIGSKIQIFTSHTFFNAEFKYNLKLNTETSPTMKSFLEGLRIAIEGANKAAKAETQILTHP
jgi:hypothetical protein